MVGHTEWVELVRVEHLPAPGEIVPGTPWWLGPAGGGAGAVMQLHRLTGAATFFTALARDDFAEQTLAFFASHGIRVEAAPRPGRSRRAFTHIDSHGERTITVIGERLEARATDPLPWDLLDRTDCVYFTAGDRGALEHARRGRVLVATSRTTSVLAGSGVELDALVGSAVDESERYDPGELHPPPRLVVMTAGESGGWFRTREGQHGKWDAAPLPAPVADRYGAGDSFAACVAFALAAGLPPAAAVAAAARAAASVITKRGPYDGQLDLDGLAIG